MQVAGLHQLRDVTGDRDYPGSVDLRPVMVPPRSRHPLRQLPEAPLLLRAARQDRLSNSWHPSDDVDLATWSGSPATRSSRVEGVPIRRNVRHNEDNA